MIIYKRHPDKRAFTLMELAVVLLILSVVAAAITVNLRGAVNNKRFDNITRRISRYDFNVRSYCKNSRIAGQLTYDLYERTIYLGIDGKLTSELPADLQLDGNIEIEDFIGGVAAGHTSSITINAYGNSGSYAVKLVTNDRSCWLLVAGMTGQLTLYNDEAKVREILATENN